MYFIFKLLPLRSQGLKYLLVSDIFPFDRFPISTARQSALGEDNLTTFIIWVHSSLLQQQTRQKIEMDETSLGLKRGCNNPPYR